MRTRKRIHPYLTPDVANRLASYCAARGITESAAVQAAVESHLAGAEKDNALILRRLDRLGRASARQDKGLEVLSEAFAVYVWYWSAYLPERTQAEQDAAGHLAGRRYEQFIQAVSTALGRGSRLASRVLKEESAAPPEDAHTTPASPPQSNKR